MPKKSANASKKKSAPIKGGAVPRDIVPARSARSSRNSNQVDYVELAGVGRVPVVKEKVKDKVVREAAVLDSRGLLDASLVAGELKKKSGETKRPSAEKAMILLS